MDGLNKNLLIQEEFAANLQECAANPKGFRGKTDLDTSLAASMELGTQDQEPAKEIFFLHFEIQKHVPNQIFEREKS
jgi:hypothetical protein